MTVLLLSSCLLLHALLAVSQAQITLDGSLGPRVPLIGPNYRIGDDLGQIHGRNLFHSFDQFTVRTGESATFTGPQTVANILSRVTGGQPSSIDGRLRSEILGANLYLLNPSGVMFGRNARLEVSGSFHVSTADYLRFEGGAKFHADLSQNSVLTVASPVAFGFLSANPAGIVIQGSTLRVADGTTLSVVGGDRQIMGVDPQITGATLMAPGGRVQVASVASAGEVTPSAPGQAPNLEVASFTGLGRINIQQASIDASASSVSASSGGTVLLRGGRLVLDRSSISANTTGAVDGARLGIDLRLTGEAVLSNSASIITLTTTSGAGRGGDVSLHVGTLTLRSGARIESRSRGRGQGGDVTVRAADAVDISGNIFGNPSTIASSTLSAGGGQVRISAPSLTISDGGTISTSTESGRGGDLVVKVGQLSLTGGAQISISGGDAGMGGNVKLRADSVTLSGPSSRIVSLSVQQGDIALEVGTLTLQNGAQIASGSPISEGGNVTVTARDAIAISNGSAIVSQAFNRNAGQVRVSAPRVTMMDNGFISTSTRGAGGAGDIALTVGTLRLTGGAQIASNSSSPIQGAGPGGRVTVTATDTVSIAGRSSTGVGASPFSNDASSGLFSTTQGPGAAGALTVSAPTVTLSDGGKLSVATTGRGRAGDITVDVGNLTLTSGALIDSSTTGVGRGGTVIVTAADLLSISGQDANGVGSGIASGTLGSGVGGNIVLQAPRLELNNGGRISVRSLGTGDAGNLVLQAGQTFRSRRGAVSAEAAQADGGNIQLTVGSRVELRNSQITASVGTGVGQGGNITIDPPFVIMQGSQVRADAFGGPGGNVRIVAGVFLADPASPVSASSALNLPGTVDIQAPVTSISGAVAPLPQAFATVAELLRDRCAERLREGRVSRFVLGGRDGVPLEPGSLLLSPPVQGEQPGPAPMADTVEGQRAAFFVHVGGLEMHNTGYLYLRGTHVQAQWLEALDVECARWRERQGTGVIRAP